MIATNKQIDDMLRYAIYKLSLEHSKNLNNTMVTSALLTFLSIIHTIHSQDTITKTPILKENRDDVVEVVNDDGPNGTVSYEEQFGSWGSRKFCRQHEWVKR